MALHVLHVLGWYKQESLLSRNIHETSIPSLPLTSWAWKPGCQLPARACQLGSKGTSRL